MRGSTGQTRSLSSLVLDSDDMCYMRKMKDILEAFPNKGPPYQPSELCRHIYMGTQRNADDITLLRRLGITHVLNCAGTRHFDRKRSPYITSTGIKKYLLIPAEDNCDYDILSHFREAEDFLDHCKTHGGKALVHCNLGINRSGAICCAYLMVDQRLPLLKVIELLKLKRSVVLCNKNFRRQLVKFAREKQLLDPLIQGIERTSIGAPLFAKSQEILDRPRSATLIREEKGRQSPSGIKKKRPFQRSRSEDDDQDFRHYGASAYCTLPRNGTPVSLLDPSASPKRAAMMTSSHYKYDLFMSPIPEDHSVKTKQAKVPSKSTEDDTNPSKAYWANFFKSKKNSKVTDMDTSESSSSTRPLRIYRRAATDSQVYQKPTHQYRGANTVDTSDIVKGFNGMSLDNTSRLSSKNRSLSKTSLTSGFFDRFRKSDSLKKGTSRTSLQF